MGDVFCRENIRSSDSNVWVPLGSDAKCPVGCRSMETIRGGLSWGQRCVNVKHGSSLAGKVRERRNQRLGCPITLVLKLRR